MGSIILGLKGDTKMRPYKNHPIYGIAVPKPGKLWQPRGLVFATDENSTIEIKRLESTDLTFATKKEAEEHALSLCRAWIDEHGSESDSRL
jgi:hypothetical protein